MTDIIERDVAVFEAGIKLGALYHQFVGTPLSTDTVEKLERTIEESIGLQPFVQTIRVSIDRKMVKKKQNQVFRYCELEGRMLHVSLKIRYKNTDVYAELAYDAQNDYPMMRVKEITKPSG